MSKVKENQDVSKKLLHNLYGHSGFHFAIFSLNDSKDKRPDLRGKT